MNVEALPFQPQGIPTLTMYESGLPGRRLWESGLASWPGLANLRPGTVLGASVNDDTAINSLPALTGVYFSFAVEVDLSEPALFGRPALSGFVWLAPLNGSTSDAGVNSGPRLTATLWAQPTNASLTDDTTINSGPGLSAFVVFWPAPTLNYVAPAHACFSAIAKTAVPSAPTSDLLYVSTTGTGTPDSNPGGWTLSVTLNATWTTSGSNWGSAANAPCGPYSIMYYVISGVRSLWSNVTAGS